MKVCNKPPCQSSLVAVSPHRRLRQVSFLTERFTLRLVFLNGPITAQIRERGILLLTLRALSATTAIGGTFISDLGSRDAPKGEVLHKSIALVHVSNMYCIRHIRQIRNTFSILNQNLIITLNKRSYYV